MDKRLLANKLKRIGETNISKNNDLMKIVEYNNAKDIIVEFQDKYKFRFHTAYSHFLKGKGYNPYRRTLYGLGYMGDIRRNKIDKIAYSKWTHMLRRCYDENEYINNPTYIDCSVCEEWHNFTNFHDWFNENYYKVGNEVICLDKDILLKGNKIYSPETCVFAPQRINLLFCKSDAIRGNLPIGVKLNKKNNILSAEMSIDNKNKFLGNYTTIDDAFNAYKKYKEDYIKQIADEYKDKIPKRLYDAMYNWIVEITD